jgi:hypothetical protein
LEDVGRVLMRKSMKNKRKINGKLKQKEKKEN